MLSSFLSSLHTRDEYELEFVPNWANELLYISLAIGLPNSGRKPICLAVDGP